MSKVTTLELGVHQKGFDLIAEHFKSNSNRWKAVHYEEFESKKYFTMKVLQSKA